MKKVFLSLTVATSMLFSSCGEDGPKVPTNCAEATILVGEVGLEFASDPSVENCEKVREALIAQLDLCSEILDEGDLEEIQNDLDGLDCSDITPK